LFKLFSFWIFLSFICLKIIFLIVQIKNIKNKIFLSHIPPSNTTIGDSSVLFPFIGGSEGVRDFIDNHKIDLTLVGHIHESSGLEEIVSNNLVVNVGKTYKIIEFDLEKRKLKLL